MLLLPSSGLKCDFTHLPGFPPKEKGRGLSGDGSSGSSQNWIGEAWSSQPVKLLLSMPKAEVEEKEEEKEEVEKKKKKKKKEKEEEEEEEKERKQTKTMGMSALIPMLPGEAFSLYTRLLDTPFSSDNEPESMTT